MPESVGIDGRMREVKERLEQLREQLDLLSSAIWQDIDHDHPTRLEEGVRFKQGYNERRRALEEDMDRMLALLSEYPAYVSEGGASDTAASPARDVADEAGSAVRAEDSETGKENRAPESGSTRSLASGLDTKVPFGFMLGGQTFSSASAWPLFYEAVLSELYSRGPDKLSRLADVPGEFVRGGKRLFARSAEDLEDPLPVADTIFAEADIPPEELLQVVTRLIAYMGYPRDSLKILLKEKNRGTLETLSLGS